MRISNEGKIISIVTINAKDLPLCAGDVARLPRSMTGDSLPLNETPPIGLIPSSILKWLWVDREIRVFTECCLFDRTKAKNEYFMMDFQTLKEFEGKTESIASTTG
jgi:hypothetical protein